jgi:hypothetical protein
LAVSRQRTEQAMSGRTISDEDAEAIAAALEDRLMKKFYADLGKGVWGMVWKVIVGGIVAVAAYGYFQGGKS